MKNSPVRPSSRHRSVENLYEGEGGRILASHFAIGLIHPRPREKPKGKSRGQAVSLPALRVRSRRPRTLHVRSGNKNSIRNIGC